MRIIRPRWRRLTAGAAGIAVLLSGCTGGDAAAGGTRITVGLIASISGAYQAVGEDMRDGFSLYLDTHGGRLGGYPVDLVVVDEGDGGADAARAAADLLQRGDLLAVTGVTNAQTVTALSPALAARGVALVSANGRPRNDDVHVVWSTSFLPEEPGQALASYLRGEVEGPVWAMAADNQSGRADLTGFADAFAAVGGRLANAGQSPLYTPDTTNFLPFLTQAKASGAEAVYAYYVGDEAISFVQQYAQSDARDLPLFGAGPLTEGSVLAAQGRAALGIRTVLNYAPDLDNPTNRGFVDAWRARHNSLPTTYAMASWDAALLLDKAVGAAGGEPSPEAVNAAIGRIGQIDSPRGTWQFSARHSPVQKWYLRRVQTDGRTLTNSLIQDLDILGAQGAA
jgi:branched-chain amino acid transport system substrate-binding protein